MCEVCDSVLRVTHDLSNLDAILFIHVCDVTSPNVRHRSYTRVKYDLSICATWLIHMCEIWLFICVKCVTLSYVRHMTDPIWMRHDSFLHVIWLIHTCIITHSHVWNLTYRHVRHGWFICVKYDAFVSTTWDIHAYVKHDSFICATCLIHMVHRVVSEDLYPQWFCPSVHHCTI